MNDLIDKYCRARTSCARIQFLRYGVVGALAAMVDIGVFYIFNTLVGWHYVAAQSMAFVAGLTVNYLLSVLWVFQSCHRRTKEIVIFVAVGVGGLLLSYLSLYLLIDVLELVYADNMVAKLVTVAVVFVWNFVLRKKYAFA